MCLVASWIEWPELFAHERTPLRQRLARRRWRSALGESKEAARIDLAVPVRLKSFNGTTCPAPPSGCAHLQE